MYFRFGSMWTQEDNTTWMQYVAKDAASRLDVVTLQEALDQRLMQRQAREMGICPVREDLYSQAFGVWRTAVVLLEMLVVRNCCGGFVVLVQMSSSARSRLNHPSVVCCYCGCVMRSG